MSRSGKEIIFEGWLTKSPPTKRIWRGRWRRRWFSLHPTEIPAQYYLSYYTDRNCRKLKGYIDLDQCEQVDTGLKFEDKKIKFDFLFAVKTPPRTYYLAADTDNELKTWVKSICDVCGLKATSDEEEVNISRSVSEARSNAPEEKQNTALEINNKIIIDSPAISPVSTSPYIPISECITGKSPILLNKGQQDTNSLLRSKLQNSYDSSQYTFGRDQINLTYEAAVPAYLNLSATDGENEQRFYDCPRSILPHKSTKSYKSAEDSTYQNFNNSSPLQSPTDSESVFTDDDWSHNTLPSEQGPKHPRPSDSSTDMDIFVSKRVGKLSLESSKIDGSVQAPPRPPKPPHISQAPNYFNLPTHSTLPKRSKETVNISHVKSNSMSEQSTVPVITDDFYDFPRSHQVEIDSTRNTMSKRHCYNNAVPVTCPDGQIFKYDISPKPGTSNSHVFRYDLDDLDVPGSPSSQSSSSAMYSNLPSPLLSDSQLMPPPAVNRCLKPRRKLSDSLSLSSNPEPSSPRLAPSVDRKLKPPVSLPVRDINSSSRISDSNYGNVLRKTFESDEENSRKIRAAPSPTPPGLRRSHDSLLADNEQIYHYFSSDGSTNKQNYHKLEYLDLDLDNITSQFTQPKQLQPLRSPGANTVYKEVDFMKTVAFNITKSNLEKERKCKK